MNEENSLKHGFFFVLKKTSPSAIRKDGIQSDRNR